MRVEYKVPGLSHGYIHDEGFIGVPVGQLSIWYGGSGILGDIRSKNLTLQQAKTALQDYFEGCLTMRRNKLRAELAEIEEVLASRDKQPQDWIENYRVSVEEIELAQKRRDKERKIWHG